MGISILKRLAAMRPALIDNAYSSLRVFMRTTLHAVRNVRTRCNNVVDVCERTFNNILTVDLFA